MVYHLFQYSVIEEGRASEIANGTINPQSLVKICIVQSFLYFGLSSSVITAILKFSKFEVEVKNLFRFSSLPHVSPLITVILLEKKKTDFAAKHCWFKC